MSNLRQLAFLFLATAAALLHGEVVHAPDASPRVLYGVERLRQVLPAGAPKIVVSADGRFPKPEGFAILQAKDGTVSVLGADDSGALYGCLELAERIRANGGRLPAKLDFSDAPVMVLRGPCIGMQKTYYLPGRKVYE